MQTNLSRTNIFMIVFSFIFRTVQLRIYLDSKRMRSLLDLHNFGIRSITLISLVINYHIVNRERAGGPRYAPGKLCGHGSFLWPSLNLFPHQLNRRTISLFQKPWEIEDMKIQWKAWSTIQIWGFNISTKGKEYNLWWVVGQSTKKRKPVLKFGTCLSPG